MMPPVSSCDVTECFFNQNQQCHANAIQVGGDHPQCDTFTLSQKHATPSAKGQVGACKVSECRFNSELSCRAPGIVVGYHQTHADCNTFTPR
ncbi:MAG: DUF1540 domain-containing protein [Armatimonadetes bacterium]|jgi:hypothetical protein|nr:DUF1540 domain-containing protein [Armatimonadota bacterium]